ncbi:MAG: fibronectin type III domain-containing protein, partial [Elusimicrobiota bacterium]
MISINNKTEYINKTAHCFKAILLAGIIFLCTAPFTFAVTYDYTGTTTSGPHDAYAYVADVFPFGDNAGNRNDWESYEATDDQYIDIYSSEDQRWQTVDPGNGDEILMWFEINNISENPRDIKQIDLTFEGQCNQAANFSIYVMRAGTDWWLDSSWDQVGTSEAIPAGTDETMTRSITLNFTDYLDGTQKLTWAVYCDSDSELVRVDYVKVDIEVPPAPVTGLTAAPGTDEGDIDLAWIASGEDGKVGQAASYDVRYNNYTNIWEQDEFTDGFLPGLWSDTDVNTSGGSYVESGGKLNITGDGTGLGIIKDEFYIVYSTVTGDFDIKVKIDSMSGTGLDEWSRAGIMVRNRLPSGGGYNAYCYMAISHQHGYVFFWDWDNDGYATKINNTAEVTASYPAYVRLKKSGTRFTGFYSTSGSDWTVLQGITEPFAATAQMVGMIAHSRNSSGNTVTVEYDYISGEWDSATQAAGEPSPKSAGGPENMTVQSMTPGTTYYFALKTTDNAGYESYISNSPDSLPKVIPPAAITDLTALTGGGEGEISLNWTAPGDDGWSNPLTAGSKFRIQHSKDPGASWDISNAQIELSTECAAKSTHNTTVPDLDDNSTYYFRIWTCDEIPKWSALSNAATAWTRAVVPGVLNFSEVNTGSIIVSWVDTNPAGTHYELEGSTGTDTDFGTLYSGPYTASFEHTGLSTNTTYFYKVRAKSIKDLYTSYNTTKDTHTLCVTPGAVTFGTVDSGSVEVSWTNNGNSASTVYSLEASTATNGSYGIIYEDTALTYTHQGLNANVTYYYKVRAKNLDDVYTGYNSENSTHTLSAVPGAVTFGTVASDSVEVSWTNNGNSASTLYSLEASTATNGDYGVIYEDTALTYTHQGLSANVTYYYKVRARNLDDVYTTYNAENSTHTLSTVPGAVTFGAVASESVEVSWTDNGNSASTVYSLEASTATNGDYGVIYENTALTYTHQGLNANVTYYYKVRSKNLDD